MNYFNKSLLILLSIGFASACTPEQMQSAISECNNNPECSIIVDNAIDAELAERGISGGKMTIAEMEKVYTMLEVYRDESTQHFFNILEKDSNFSGMMQMILAQFSSDSQYQQDINTLTSTEYLNMSNNLNIKALNTENKQLFTNSGKKYILYKTGYNRFVYEVYSDVIDSYVIDVDLKKVYHNGEVINGEVIPNLANTVKDILDGEYNSDLHEVISTEDELTLWACEQVRFIFGEYADETFSKCDFMTVSMDNLQYAKLSNTLDSNNNEIIVKRTLDVYDVVPIIGARYYHSFETHDLKAITLSDLIDSFSIDADFSLLKQNLGSFEIEPFDYLLLSEINRYNTLYPQYQEALNNNTFNNYTNQIDIYFQPTDETIWEIHTWAFIGSITLESKLISVDEEGWIHYQISLNSEAERKSSYLIYLLPHTDGWSTIDRPHVIDLTHTGESGYLKIYLIEGDSKTYYDVYPPQE